MLVLAADRGFSFADPYAIGLAFAGFAVFAAVGAPSRQRATAIGFTGSRTPPRERAFIGWFGVRGIGSLYYVAVALGLGILSIDEARSLFWAVAACVVASIVVHGVTAAPLSRRLLPQPPP